MKWFMVCWRNVIVIKMKENSIQMDLDRKLKMEIRSNVSEILL